MKLNFLQGTEPKAVWRFVAQCYDAFGREEGADPNTQPKAIQRAVEANNPGYRLAIIADNRGLIALAATPTGLEILDLFVKPQYRRQGLASGAISQLKHGSVAPVNFNSEIKAPAKAETIKVDVSMHNQQAQAFYQTLGFALLNTRLVFPLPTTQAAAATVTATAPLFYDVESDQWLPLAWPHSCSSDAAARAAAGAGAQRLWVELPNDAFEDLTNQWQSHPLARQMIWKRPSGLTKGPA